MPSLGTVRTLCVPRADSLASCPVVNPLPHYLNGDGSVWPRGLPLECVFASRNTAACECASTLNSSVTAVDTNSNTELLVPQCPYGSGPPQRRFPVQQLLAQADPDTGAAMLWLSCGGARAFREVTASAVPTPLRFTAGPCPCRCAVPFDPRPPCWEHRIQRIPSARQPTDRHSCTCELAGDRVLSDSVLGAADPHRHAVPGVRHLAWLLAAAPAVEHQRLCCVHSQPRPARQVRGLTGSSLLDSGCLAVSLVP